MGSISRKDKTILLTGISGFVGSWIAHAFLEAGYHVRGTVRSEKSIDAVKKVHAEHTERLSFAIVPDVAAFDALNDAVQGVTGIVHTANPFILNPKDNEEDLLKSSISGVLNTLKAAAGQGSSIRRVVLTASFASNLDLSKGNRPGFTYDETIWNPATYEEAKASDSGAFTYCAAKALAERAAWDWIKRNKPAFSKTVPDPDFAGFADVSDVSLTHLRAYESKEASGGRFIVGDHFEYQTAVDLLRKDFPQIKGRIPEGSPGQPPETYTINNSKVQRILGIKLTPLQTTLKDTVEDLLRAEKNQKS